MVLAGYTNKVIKNVKEAEEYVIRIYLWTIQPTISSCHQPVEELVSFLYLIRCTRFKTVKVNEDFTYHPLQVGRHCLLICIFVCPQVNWQRRSAGYFACRELKGGERIWQSIYFLSHWRSDENTKTLKQFFMNNKSKHCMKKWSRNN